MASAPAEFTEEEGTAGVKTLRAAILSYMKDKGASEEVMATFERDFRPAKEFLDPGKIPLLRGTGKDQQGEYYQEYRDFHIKPALGDDNRVSFRYGGFFVNDGGGSHQYYSDDTIMAAQLAREALNHFAEEGNVFNDKWNFELAGHALVQCGLPIDEARRLVASAERYSAKAQEKENVSTLRAAIIRHMEENGVDKNTIAEFRTNFVPQDEIGPDDLDAAKARALLSRGEHRAEHKQRLEQGYKEERDFYMTPSSDGRLSVHFKGMVFNDGAHNSYSKPESIEAAAAARNAVNHLLREAGVIKPDEKDLGMKNGDSGMTFGMNAEQAAAFMKAASDYKDRPKAAATAKGKADTGLDATKVEKRGVPAMIIEFLHTITGGAFR